MTASTLSLRARWTFPVDGPPLRDATLTFAEGRIVALGHHDPSAPVVDLGNVAIVPGLVNAHTHLEFSDIRVPLGHRGMSLPDWIRLVVQQRHQEKRDTEAILRGGMQEAVGSGTTTLGEILTSPWPADQEPIADVTLFHEAIGFKQELVSERLAVAQAFLSTANSSLARPLTLPSPLRGEEVEAALLVSGSLVRGLSPHAPYSVHPRLLDGLIELAIARQAPLAMHLAESPEELELLATGGGPFREMLEAFGAWSSDTLQPGTRVLDYLQRLAPAPRTLVIHGNYLSVKERQFLAAHPSMTVVYCPRTHAYFGHEPYPLAELLAGDVRVALGTDSRASNPDLSLLEEMRFAAQRHPAVSPQAILELGTWAGAKALGQDHVVGTLGPGKWANLAVLSLPETEARDPHDLLFDPTTKVRETWYRGKRCESAPAG